MKKRALIIGCGDIGIRLGHRLHSAGYHVIAARRNTSKLPPEFESLQLDLYHTDWNIPTDIDVLFYTAAANSRNPDDYEAIYYSGLKNTVTQLMANNSHCQHIYFISSTSVYDQHEGQWINEDADAKPTSATATHLRNAERWLIEQAIPATIIRSSGIYGPGRTRLLTQALQGKPPVNAIPVYSNRIHAEDLSGFITYLTTIPNPEPLYIATDCEPTSTYDVMLWLSEQLGTTHLQADTLPSRASKKLSNKRMLATGYQMQFPDFKTGYSALIKEWKGTNSD